MAKRRTIKDLEAEIEQLDQTVNTRDNYIERLTVENTNTKERLKQIAAENETLRQDIRWYKQLIQSLVSPDKKV